MAAPASTSSPTRLWPTLAWSRCATRSRLSVGEGIREDEVRIVLTTTDGRRIEKHVEHSIGSLERPMTDDDISAKFLDLAEAVIGRDAARRALEGAWAVERSEDLTQLLAITRSESLRAAAE